MWVDANFKETQIANMRIGQPVTITTDIYGDDVKYTGKVVGLDMGTGSAFSLLPAQNATGNWIKVVQRLPVRIELDQKQLEQYPLRIGLSTLVSVNTTNRDGQVLANKVRSTPVAVSTAREISLAPVNKLIDDIVKLTLANPEVRVMQQQKPLEGAQLVIMTIALSLATFMQVLDSTIANVAIPTIAGNLGSSLSQGTWVITSFGVANAISIPLTGWLAKRVGEVKLFLWSTIAFAIASWACGVSSSLNMLIFFRVIQGIVAGPLIPLSQSLLLNNYPPAKRSIALALWSMTVIVAPICGPILGGYISDNYHWGWIFFINVPIGVAVVLMTLQTLRGRETRTERRRIDAVGLALLVIGIGSLQIMLDRGKELDWFSSQEIIILTVVAVVAICFLIVWG